ncbi:trypsin-like peptidase domain-containing protein [Actinomadura sp. WMMB 499]|uniref:VMAP-C domain-containing protein n=1 Tax=Actinomadura sp. WMMB 499 TaxID=1219491 RepID=UPI0012443D77|nr:trypsin-like peptidase domain-containing protein [Actinomadura sp. WMMB 499]QFG24891.1 trypsin-like peptidase domain-containing protein [Actinomadura sp. WMMB 499]
MGDLDWRAWVGGAGGGKLGAAFLVTPTRLLTCAHTVQGRDEARVGFPGLAEDLPAKVVRCGDWARPGDPGDVAVLELAEPVPWRPAVFADPAAASGGWFGVCGFPDTRDGAERHATVITDPAWSRRREWQEIRTGPNDVLQAGFSGSAVYDTGTGEVIGMVTNAEKRGGADRGWMLPVSRIRLYWEELDDLLPLSWLTATARRELRELLAGIACDESMAADVAGATGRPRADGFRSAWDAVRYVAEGWPQDRLVRFLGGFGRHLPEARRRPLAGWTGRHLPAAPADEPGAAPPSVIVRLERQTFDDAFDLTVQTWVGGAVGTSRNVGKVQEKGVRRAVETAVAEAAGTLDALDYMIEFAVPEKLLGRPFEQWYADPVSKIQMRKFPVVVRDVQRLHPGSIRRNLAWRRWRTLTDRGCAEPETVGCDTPRRGGDFEDRLEANPHYAVLVYGTKPVKPWLTAALNNGIPVMLWPRTACDGASHDDCPGNRLSGELSSAVRGEQPGDLPRVAHRLRQQARGAPKGEPHCGRDLTMLWDDPSRLPDPPLAMEA